MSEKYGFVYIWRDRKHKRYYVGCHWGTIDDGYVCSSSWMKRAYKIRPEDFKRRILNKFETRQEMRDGENRLLSLIDSIELGKKYYNVYNHNFDHWSNEDIQRHHIGEKIANAWTDERREQQSERMKGNSNPIKRKEVAERRERTIENNGGLTAWNKGTRMTEEQRALHSVNMMKRANKDWNVGIPRSEETKDKISSTWIVVDPEGREEIINNLVRFCKERGLSPDQMRRVGRGIRKQHQGYTVKKYEKSDV